MDTIYLILKNKMKKKLFFLLAFFISWSCCANPIPAHEAFKVAAKPIDPNTFLLTWQIKPGYFIYSKRIKLSLAPQSNLHLGTINLPKPLIKTDKLGKQLIYRNKLTLPVSILGEQPGEDLLTLTFQGCSDSGFCYPPETRQVRLSIDKTLALIEAHIEDTILEDSALPSTASDGIFSNTHWTIALVSFFGVGLLLAFTPCILPMVPILSSIIVGQNNPLTTRRAFLLSLIYVVSMALTYALIGAMVAILGKNLQLLMQSPWIIAAFSLLFIFLGFSMLDYFTLKFPGNWQFNLSRISQRQSSQFMGAAIMGSLSILILSPCVTPPLVGVLSYIAQGGHIAFGSITLFFMGLGMGTPLLLLGISAGKWLPKAGTWMNGIKLFFGLLLFAVAIYLLDRILPSFFTMILWASLLIFAGLHCGTWLFPFSLKRSLLRQGFGAVSVLYGLLILVGGSLGNSNPLQPLTSKQGTLTTLLPITNLQEIEHALAHAKGKPVLLDFYADWCISCKIIESTTLKDPDVVAALKKMLVLRIDITANNTNNKALLKKYNVIAPPTFLFFTKEGQEVKHFRLVGDLSKKKLLGQLQKMQAI